MSFKGKRQYCASGRSEAEKGTPKVARTVRFLEFATEFIDQVRERRRKTKKNAKHFSRHLNYDNWESHNCAAVIGAPSKRVSMGVLRQ